MKLPKLRCLLSTSILTVGLAFLPAITPTYGQQLKYKISTKYKVKMANYVFKDGRYHVPLVDFGNRMQERGWNVSEHSKFGGVTPGIHDPKGHHPTDEAIDMHWDRSNGDFGPDGKTSWQDFQAEVGRALQGAGSQILHRDYDPTGGHGTHVHVGVTGGMMKLTPEQYQRFGWTHDGETPQPAASADEVIKTAKERAEAYSEMSKGELDTEYDKQRSGDEGQIMHNAYFNKPQDF